MSSSVRRKYLLRTHHDKRRMIGNAPRAVAIAHWQLSPKCARFDEARVLRESANAAWRARVVGIGPSAAQELVRTKREPREFNRPPCRATCADDGPSMRRSFGRDLIACACRGRMTSVALMVDAVGSRRLMRHLTSAAEDHGIAPARASPATCARSAADRSSEPDHRPCPASRANFEYLRASSMDDALERADGRVRKRIRYTRQRAKRTRPQIPAPQTGWVIAELARLSQLPVRRIRNHLEHRLIEPTEVRGIATRYQRRELLRVLGIARLRAETSANLTAIKRKLDALGDRDLEAWLRTQPLPPAAAAALGFPMPAAHRKSTAYGPGGLAPASNLQPGSARIGSTRQRVSLLPGLELMIAADASPAALNAAHRIWEEYVGPSQPSGSW
jgi:hypothetical protein